MHDCKKCGSQGIVLLRKTDYYCKECFNASVNHKFRASIGKNKIFPKHEKVLTCLSGGKGSTVLLDLVHHGICLDNHKKLWITPIFFHLSEFGINSHSEVEKLLIKQCSLYNYNIYFCHISEYAEDEVKICEPNRVTSCNPVTNNNLKSLLDSMPNSSKSDFLAKVKRDMFIKCAKQLGCNNILTAETSSTLATNLLCNITLGRGSQVQHIVGFCDSRNDVKIYRPMKDVTSEEITLYININKLEPMECQTTPKNSLQSVIETFVNDLQENYPSTISTVCKTADKIGIKIESIKKCVICESTIGDIDKLSALQATNYSRIVSNKCNENITSDDNGAAENHSSTIFPFVNKRFCYACSKNYSEIDKTYIPNKIKDFLI